MKYDNFIYCFSPEKNFELIKNRKISFEEIIAAIEDGAILDVLEHPNTEKYSGQKVYVVDINGYAYFVPFVKNKDNEIFLKTIFPSRKLTKKYLRKG